MTNRFHFCISYSDWNITGPRYAHASHSNKNSSIYVTVSNQQTCDGPQCTATQLPLATVGVLDLESLVTISAEKRRKWPRSLQCQPYTTPVFVTAKKWVGPTLTLTMCFPCSPSNTFGDESLSIIWCLRSLSSSMPLSQTSQFQSTTDKMLGNKFYGNY